MCLVTFTLKNLAYQISQFNCSRPSKTKLTGMHNIHIVALIFYYPPPLQMEHIIYFVSFEHWEYTLILIFYSTWMIKTLYLGNRYPNVEGLHRYVGVNVLLVEYRGYGHSEGSPSESGELWLAVCHTGS